MIGALGSLLFNVSDKDIHTFQSLKRQSSGRWAEHTVHGQKPKLEFLGESLDTITFSMSFVQGYGQNPRYAMEELMKMTRNGEAYTLIVGGDAMGYNKWIVESVDQEWGEVSNKGKVLTGKVTVSLKEYIE